MMTRTERIGAAAGITVLVFYLVSATQIVRDTNLATLALAFAIGPVAIVGIGRFVKSLGHEASPGLLHSGRFFLVTAFVLLTVMIVIQQTIALQFRDMLAAASDAARADTIRVAFGAVNQVQLGLDFAFDIFYCIGLIALARALYGHPSFGRAVGAFGIVSGVALLTLNLIAFPRVPSEAGLIDLGPVTGVWWLIVIAMKLRQSRLPSPPVVA